MTTQSCDFTYYHRSILWLRKVVVIVFIILTLCRVLLQHGFDTIKMFYSLGKFLLSGMSGISDEESAGVVCAS